MLIEMNLLINKTQFPISEDDMQKKLDLKIQNRN